MSARQKLWAKIQRQKLLNVFGEKCRVCGGRECLEFDCIKPTGDKHHRFDTSQRISYYRSQAAMGNLQVLCQRCNAIKSDADMETAFGALFANMLAPLPSVEINPF